MNVSKGIGRGRIYCRVDGLTEADWQHVTEAYATLSDELVQHNHLKTKTIEMDGFPIVVLDVPVDIDRENKQLSFVAQLTHAATYVFPFVVVFSGGDWDTTHNNECIQITNQFSVKKVYEDML